MKDKWSWGFWKGVNSYCTGLARGLCFGSVHWWWIFWPGLFLWQIFTSLTVFAEPILSMSWTYLKYVMSFYLLRFFVLTTGNCHFLQMTKSALFSLTCKKYCNLRARVPWRTFFCFIKKKNIERNDTYMLFSFTWNYLNYKQILKFFLHSF